jgi:hypothetical protein
VVAVVAGAVVAETLRGGLRTDREVQTLVLRRTPSEAAMAVLTVQGLAGC